MFLLGTVYASNIKKYNAELFSEIENEINKIRKRFHDIEIILGGDFSTVPNVKMDRFPIPVKSPTSDSELSIFCENVGVIDIWRYKYPHLKEYTWSNRDKSKQSRINFWLISSSLDQNTNRVSIEPSILSDHKMIYLIIKMNNETSYKNSKTYWKFNNRLLEIDIFQREIKKIIQTYWNKAKRTNLYCKNWELMKFQIRISAIDKGKEVAKSNKLKEEEIIKAICNITNNDSEGNSNLLMNLQAELDKLYIIKAKGSFVRSRRRWLEEGETNSRYFYNLEKRNGEYTSIRKLNINGHETQDPIIISKYVSDFYGKLYSSNTCSVDKIEDFLKPLKQNIACIEDFKALCD